MYFSDTIQMLDSYYWRNHGRVELQIFNELRTRLKQLSVLHSQITVSVDKLLSQVEAEGDGSQEDTIYVVIFTNLSEPKNPNANDYKAPSLDEVEPSELLLINVEAFYYLAHKFGLLCRQSRGRLPGLETFNAAGIQRVRNNLIEHSNQANGQDLYTFSISRPAGPSLRRMSQGVQKSGYVDQGLWVNAKEFKLNLERVLETPP